MRSSGVLMHISSLPSPYGIGTMGAEARKFADFLDKSGQPHSLRRESTGNSAFFIFKIQKSSILSSSKILKIENGWDKM